MTLDIKNFYLNTPLKQYIYLWLKTEYIQVDERQQYKLNEKVTHGGWVYMEIRKGMYSLPQAVFLTQEFFATWLAEHGYTQSKLTSGLWLHQMKPIQF